MLPHLWDECDIMLIGPSRAGKTPLSFYLAQRGFKVANYPLVPEEEPPKEPQKSHQTSMFSRVSHVFSQIFKRFKLRTS